MGGAPKLEKEDHVLEQVMDATVWMLVPLMQAGVYKSVLALLFPAANAILVPEVLKLVNAVT